MMYFSACKIYSSRIPDRLVGTLEFLSFAILEIRVGTRFSDSCSK
jgi:hypothetical protein